VLAKIAFAFGIVVLCLVADRFLEWHVHRQLKKRGLYCPEHEATGRLWWLRSCQSFHLKHLD
jgi:hypothetical protein